MKGEELALMVMLKVLVEEEAVVKMWMKGEGLMVEAMLKVYVD